MDITCICSSFNTLWVDSVSWKLLTFDRFSQVHEFEKPNDEAALNLLNSCSAAVLEEFPDIIFAYGYSDEYRFQSSLCLTLFVLGFYTLTHSLLFSLSSVALCSRKHQDSTRDEPGLDSSKTWSIYNKNLLQNNMCFAFLWLTLTLYTTVFCLIRSKILSLVASFFAAVYVTKWKEFFPQRKLEYTPSFTSKVVSCASPEVLQAYLAWRQQDCKTYWAQK